MATDKSKKKTVLVMEEDEEYPVFEDKEWYKAKFIDHNEDEGKFGPIIFLQFKILTGEMQDGTPARGRECRALLPAKLTPSSKLYDFVKVFEDGRELDIEDVVDLEAYYGKIVKVFVEHGKEDAEGRPYQNITGIRPYKSSKNKSKKKSKK